MVAGGSVAILAQAIWLKSVVEVRFRTSKIPTPMAQRHVLDAARAAVLAAHSAAGLATGPSREAARLLRTAEASARAAVAVLEETRRTGAAPDGSRGNATREVPPGGAGGGTSGGAPADVAKRRRKRCPKTTAKTDLKPMDVEDCGLVASPPAGGGTGEAMSSRRPLVRHETLPATPTTDKSAFEFQYVVSPFYLLYFLTSCTWFWSNVFCRKMPPPQHFLQHVPAAVW